MTQLESITKTVQAALGLLSRAAGSDVFQVDVVYRSKHAEITCFPYTEQQANALHAFVQAFIWSNAEVKKYPYSGWIVTITIKAEETK